MTWVAVAIVGGAAIGGIASNEAANKQVSASNRASGQITDQLTQTRQGLMPWQQSGGMALSDLNNLLGIGDQNIGSNVAGQSEDEIRQSLLDDWQRKMPGTKPNMQQIEEAVQHNLSNQRLYNRNQSQQGLYGSLTKPFDLSMFQQSPAYQFNLDQGMNAINKAASARGNYYAPQTLQDIGKYSQGVASNEFQNAFNNYNTNQNSLFNKLYSVSGSGQNAAAQLGGFGSNAAGQISQNTQAGGNAQAAGIVGMANAGTGALQNALWLQYLQNPTYGSGGVGQSQGVDLSNVQNFAGGGYAGQG